MILDMPRARKQTTRYGKNNSVNMSELDSSDSGGEPDVGSIEVGPRCLLPCYCNHRIYYLFELLLVKITSYYNWFWLKLQITKLILFIIYLLFSTY